MATITLKSANTPAAFPQSGNYSSAIINTQSSHNIYISTKTGRLKYKSVYQPVCFDWESFTTYHEFE